jgi:hypothetical protein
MPGSDRSQSGRRAGRIASWPRVALGAVRRWAGWVAWLFALAILVWLGVGELAREFGWSLTALASFGPVATALTAAVALMIGVITIRQKSLTDRREQWWKRVQWALDNATSGNDSEQGVAFAALTTLLKDETATTADAKMLLAAVDALGLLQGLVGDVQTTIEDAEEAVGDPATEGERAGSTAEPDGAGDQPEEEL